MTTNSSTRKRNSASKNTNGNKNTASGRSRKNTASQPIRQVARQRSEQERMISNELTLLVLLAITILLFLCNFGIIGPVGNVISGFLFGLFGILAYIAPLFIFVAVAFGISNQGNFHAILKLVAAIVLFIVISCVMHLFQGKNTLGGGYALSAIYNLGKEGHAGGGASGGW